MPAVSKAQQHLMGMVHAFKQGALKLSKLPDSLAEKIKKMAGSISDKAAKEFASTSQKHLPKHITEVDLTFVEYLIIESYVQEACSMEDEEPAVSKDVTRKASKKGGKQVRFNKKALGENWGVADAVHPSRKGMFDGKTKQQLTSELSRLTKSGPHKEGSAAYTKMKQLQFALRAKNHWGDAE